MIRVINLTNFFNRELFMYSIGDIKLKKPISLKRVAYTTAFFIIWSLPLYLLFGIHFNPIYMAFLIGVPIAGGYLAAKPMFGGKGLLDYLKTLIAFMGEPRSWLDFKSSNNLSDEVFYVEDEIWVSRRREISTLARNA